MAKRVRRSANGPSLKLDIQAANETSQDQTLWTNPIRSPSAPQKKTSFQISSDRCSQTTQTTSEMNGAEKQKYPGDMSPRTPPVVEPRLPFMEKYFSWRYVIVFLLQTSLVVFVFLRSCMTMALVCMTELPGATTSTVSSSSEASFVNYSDDGVITSHKGHGGADNTSQDMGGNNTWTHVKLSHLEFSWSSQVQGLILTSALFLSPVAPLLPNVIKRIFKVKNKHIMSATNLFAAVMTLLSPMGARISPYVLVALRLLLGLVGGACVPIIGDVIAWWAPRGEKLSMSAFTFVGISFGGILSSLFAGFLCSIPVDNGWPFIFYVFGSLTILWGVAWHFLCTEKPEEHPYISDSEKEYILLHRSDMASGGENSSKGNGVPWKQMMASIPLLAAFGANCCYYWATNIVITYLPPYLSTVLEFNVQQVGVLASLVSLTRIFGTFSWTVVGNLMAQKFSTRSTRKICITTGFVLSAIAIVGVAFCGKNERWLAYGILLICMATQACGTSHLVAVPQDMAPRYAGLITGMFFSIGSLVAITGPLIISNITTNGTQEEWMVVWLIKGGVFLLGALCFGVLGKASLQPWAKVDSKSVQQAPSTLVDLGKRISVVMDRSPVVVTVTPPPDANGNRTFSIEVQAPTMYDNSMKYCGDNKLSGETSHGNNGRSHQLHSQPGEETEGLDNNAFNEEKNWTDECNNDKTEINHYPCSANDKIIEITKL